MQNQARQNSFRIYPDVIELLYDPRFVFEVPERIRIHSNLSPAGISLPHSVHFYESDVPTNSDRFRVYESGEIVEVLSPFPLADSSEYQDLVTGLKVFPNRFCWLFLLD